MKLNHLSQMNYAPDQDTKGGDGTPWKLIKNLVNPYSPEEQKRITDILYSLYSISYNSPEKAFYTIEPSQVDSMWKYLDALIPLFEKGNHNVVALKQQIDREVKKALSHLSEDGGQPIDRIVFLYAWHSRSLQKGIDDIEYGEAINKEFNVDMYDEDGNGGCRNYINTQGNDRFGQVCASEDLIKKRPNIVAIIISAPLRPKRSTMAHHMYNPNAVELMPGAREKIWHMSDEEVKKEFWVEDDGER